VAAVIDPQRRTDHDVRREPDQDREHAGADDERREARVQRGTGERVPEVPVEQTVPREVRNLPPVVAQEQPAERVSRGVDRGKRPGVSHELAEQRVDAVQAEEEREADRDQEVDADERRESDADAERDRGGDPLRRLLPAEQVREKDLQPPPELQPVLAAAAERARDLDFHRAEPK